MLKNKKSIIIAEALVRIIIAVVVLVLVIAACSRIYGAFNKQIVPETDMEKAIACSYYRCFEGCASNNIDKIKLIPQPDGGIKDCSDFCDTRFTISNKICGYDSIEFPVEVKPNDGSYFDYYNIPPRENCIVTEGSRVGGVSLFEEIDNIINRKPNVKVVFVPERLIDDKTPCNIGSQTDTFSKVKFVKEVSYIYTFGSLNGQKSNGITSVSDEKFYTVLDEPNNFNILRSFELRDIYDKYHIYIKPKGEEEKPFSVKLQIEKIDDENAEIRVDDSNGIYFPPEDITNMDEGRRLSIRGINNRWYDLRDDDGILHIAFTGFEGNEAFLYIEYFPEIPYESGKAPALHIKLDPVVPVNYPIEVWSYHLVNSPLHENFVLDDFEFEDGVETTCVILVTDEDDDFGVINDDEARVFYVWPGTKISNDGSLWSTIGSTRRKNGCEDYDEEECDTSGSDFCIAGLGYKCSNRQTAIDLLSTEYERRYRDNWDKCNDEGIDSCTLLENVTRDSNINYYWKPKDGMICDDTGNWVVCDTEGREARAGTKDYICSNSLWEEVSSIA